MESEEAVRHLHGYRYVGLQLRKQCIEPRCLYYKLGRYDGPLAGDRHHFIPVEQPHRFQHEPRCASEARAGLASQAERLVCELVRYWQSRGAIQTSHGDPAGTPAGTQSRGFPRQKISKVLAAMIFCSKRPRALTFQNFCIDDAVKANLCEKNDKYPLSCKSLLNKRYA